MSHLSASTISCWQTTIPKNFGVNFQELLQVLPYCPHSPNSSLSPSEYVLVSKCVCIECMLESSSRVCWLQVITEQDTHPTVSLLLPSSWNGPWVNPLSSGTEQHVSIQLSVCPWAHPLLQVWKRKKILDFIFFQERCIHGLPFSSWNRCEKFFVGTVW